MNNLFLASYLFLINGNSAPAFDETMKTHWEVRWTIIRAYKMRRQLSATIIRTYKR
ncbi:MAG: hypothetical protein ACTTKI_05970 [Tannerella sp.]|uniref:hypothetical protein n=1 Tax=Tannerella sp. TaxID=2382127 RepID=UPI003FA23120